VIPVRSLESLENVLNKALKGQREAIGEFARAARLAWEGAPRPNRTRGFVLLLGPTGTGKTEMTLLTAQELFGEYGSTKNFARFDMAEYQHRDAIIKLLGGAGEKPLLGIAIDKLNDAGGGILLLDEIEKAEPNLVKVLLSFDAARVTMNDGDTKDLSRIFIVMTSNLGSAEAARMRSAPYSTLRRHILNAAREFFSPEVLARFSARIVTNRLSYDVQREIAEILLKKELSLQTTHLLRDVVVDTNEVVRFLINKGFTPELGARTVRNAIETLVGAALLPYVNEMPSPLSIGNRLSRQLYLTVQNDELRAGPPERSSALQQIIQRHEAALAIGVRHFNGSQNPT